MTLRPLVRWVLTGLLLLRPLAPTPTIARRSHSTTTTPPRSASTRQSRSSSPSSSITCLPLQPFPRPRRRWATSSARPRSSRTRKTSMPTSARSRRRPRASRCGRSARARRAARCSLQPSPARKTLQRSTILNKSPPSSLIPAKRPTPQTAALVHEAKPFYWLSGSIHSPETGSPEMLMELAYRLAVEDSAHIQAIRKDLIVLITPVVEVDGRDRMLDVYRYRKANPGKQTPGLVYWGKYVAHDNNRDAMGMALALSKVMMKTFLDWHPQVFHDLHESVPYLYTSTGTGPYNSWLDPIVVAEWQKLAYHEIEGMTRRGVPGVWTHGFYDGWAPNYMFYIANGHNAIGRFYETFGNGGADTRERKLPESSTSRTWYRPNPPLPKVKWSLRNNVNMQQSALLLALKYVADNREEFVNNFALKSKRSVAKAKTEGPAAWIIPNDGKRPALAAQLAQPAAAPGGRDPPPRS